LFPSVRLNADTLIDLAPPEMWGGDGPDAARGAVNLNHFCLCVNTEEWSALEARLAAAGVVPEAGPMTLWGAHGDATAYYYKDPEGNHVEFRYYGAD
jgi:extradiol dioxygenase family protein